MYIKDDLQLQDQMKKMYSIIWGNFTDGIWATFKSISGFSAKVDKFDAIGMLKLTQKAMFNV